VRKQLKVEENGQIVIVANSFIDEEIEGMIPIETDLDDADIAINYYYENGLVKKPPSPSERHEWDFLNKVWHIPLLRIMNLKKGDMHKSCRGAIYAGYSSTALGSLHHYPANDKDQVNMIASVTDSYNPANDSNWKTLFWCKDANDVWDYREHTAEQIRKAGADGKAHITAQLSKNALLQSQISEATTLEEIDAIVW
jgi:hypothetical protein